MSVQCILNVSQASRKKKMLAFHACNVYRRSSLSKLCLFVRGDVRSRFGEYYTRDTPRRALCVGVTCIQLGTRNDGCSRQVRAWDARRRLNVFVEGDYIAGTHAAPFQHHGADLSHPRIQEHLTLSPNQANRRARVAAHRIAGAAPLPN